MLNITDTKSGIGGSIGKILGINHYLSTDTCLQCNAALVVLSGNL